MTAKRSATCRLGGGLILALAFALGFGGGCASKPDNSQKFKPGGGIAEYREITDNATKAIQRALASLVEVASQSNRCSPEALQTLNGEVQRLQVDSLQVRARTQAILARGDAYFERWHETLARVEDPEVRSLAEQRRPLLEEKFRQIKQASQACQTAFKPFLSGLRGLRNALEPDPTALRTEPNQELLAKTRGSGEELLRQLSNVREGLDAMKALLTPSAKEQENKP